jgi:hypothetical protein
MNFGEMVDKIATRTIRPDKEDEIKEAINDAIEYCTVNGSFARDLTEGSVTVDGTVYSQSIVVSTTFGANFRKIKYLKPYGYNRFLKWRDPARVFDDKDQACTDVWYRAGDNIVIRTSVLVTSILYAYYAFPDRLVNDEDEHWMLDYMQGAIFNYALADIWNSVGNDSEAARCERKADKFLSSHRIDHQDSVAR